MDSRAPRVRQIWPILWSVIMILSVPAISRAAELDREVSRIVRSLDLGSSTVAYHILDLDTGAMLAANNADTLMLPASNMKLLTTGAALVVLGPDFAFETRVDWDGERLTIVGSGDPALGDPQLLEGMGVSIDGLFDLWVDAVVHEGIERVEELVVDDRIFDDQWFHPTWPLDQLNRSYCAEVSGFNFFLNVVSFYPRPSSIVGAAPDYRLEPDLAPWLLIENRARTTNKPKTQNSLWIERVRNANEFTLHGIIRLPQHAPIDVTVNDPGELFAHWFAHKLNRRGIPVRSARSAVANDPVSPQTSIGSVIRTPISTIISRCNRDSENLYAEALLKRIGRDVTGQRGSWGNGAAVVRTLLSKHLGPGMATDAVIADGSGLSRDNRLTPRLLTTWLQYVRSRDDLADIYMDSLAVGGESGTLARRFGDTELTGRALGKSGYINGVSCLSGYVVAGNGRAAAFSVLVNDIPADVPIRRAKELQERIVGLVDGYLSQSQELAETGGRKLGG